jgi:hypothetical protein
MKNNCDLSSKRIGIMTFPGSESYGAILQEHALYTFVRSRGYDAEIIYYINRYMKKHGHIVSCENRIIRKVKSFAGRLIHVRMYHAFRRFEAKMAHFPSRLTDKRERLLYTAHRYKGVICGSDQVWNPEITNRDMSFFLDFCGPDTKRIAYAPSFGIDKLPDDCVVKMAEELRKFHALSVREGSGADIVERLIGFRPVQTLDPTFLLPLSYWKSIEHGPKCSSPYVLCYGIKHSCEMRDFAMRLAIENDIKLIVVGGNAISKARSSGVEYANDVSPEEWLGLISNASFVVTNSFHGLAFSIIYHKEFFVTLPSLANSRLTDLINRLGLEHRVVDQSSETGTDPIDFSFCDRLLEGMRRDSEEYLDNALK